jgi:ADP-dependent phosphofructokinase/glucokinase
MSDNPLKENLDGIRGILDDAKPLKIQRIYHQFFKKEEVNKDEEIEILRRQVCDMFNSRAELQMLLEKTIEDWKKQFADKARETLKSGYSPLREVTTELQTRQAELFEMQKTLNANENFIQELEDRIEALESSEASLKEENTLLKSKIQEWMAKERKNISEEVWGEMAEIVKKE